MKIYSRWCAAVLLVSAWHTFGSGAVVASEQICAEAVTTAEMRKCVNRRYAEFDQELNDVYTRLISQLDSEHKKLLRDAQRAWIAYRDKNAAFVAGVFEDGTLYPVIEISERASRTERRIEELKAHMQ